jgi:hypothetical protein
MMNHQLLELMMVEVVQTLIDLVQENLVHEIDQLYPNIQMLNHDHQHMSIEIPIQNKPFYNSYSFSRKILL